MASATINHQSAAVPSAAQAATTPSSLGARCLAALAGLGRRAHADPDLPTFMAEAAALAATTLDVDYSAVLQSLPSEGMLRCVAGFGWPDGIAGQGGASLDKWLVHEHGIASSASAPIAGATQPFGVLSVYTRSERGFTREEEHFLEVLANMLASMIERKETNSHPHEIDVGDSGSASVGKPHTPAVVRDTGERAQTYELLEQRVAERTRELSAILEVAHNVASTLELAPLLGLILDQLKQVVDYTGAAIFTVEEQYVRVVDYRGPLRRDGMLSLRIPLAEALGHRAVSHEKGPVIVDRSWPTHRLARNFDAYAYFKSMAEYANTWLVVPLMIQERVFGVLRIDHAAEYAYTPHHASLAMAFATHVAVAIENARLYEQAREAAAMQERYRLARELHDSVSQALYGVTMYAEATAALLADNQHETAANYMHVLRDTAQDALREMRLLIFELRPAKLAEGGLITALQARLAAVEGRVGNLTTHLHVEGDVMLPAMVEQAIYGIAQESLNNVLKHAKAQTVTLSLWQTDAAAMLQIVDDGVGFELANVTRAGGLGMRGMDERAAQVGGRLLVQSAPGQGTTVRVEVPL